MQVLHHRSFERKKVRTNLHMHVLSFRTHPFSKSVPDFYQFWKQHCFAKSSSSTCSTSHCIQISSTTVMKHWLVETCTFLPIQSDPDTVILAALRSSHTLSVGYNKVFVPNQTMSLMTLGQSFLTTCKNTYKIVKILDPTGSFAIRLFRGVGSKSKR